MITAARRTVLGLLGLATVNALNARARAQEVVPARRPGDVASEGVGLSVPPGPLVSGTYEIVHQEGYAVALLAVGFSQDTLLQQLRLGPQRITIAAAPSTISFGFGSDVRSRVPLNSPVAIDIPGAHITDWLARFDLPSRQSSPLPRQMVDGLRQLRRFPLRATFRCWRLTARLNSNQRVCEGA